MVKRIAVVGAGVSGLACASELKSMGHEVVVYEKSRGPGGRTPTRWLDRESAHWVGVDHGAQYFQASQATFLEIVHKAQQAGAVKPWAGMVVDLGYGMTRPHPSSSPRWVGSPGMASLARYLAQGLDLRLETRVVGVTTHHGKHTVSWLRDGGHSGSEDGFDALICAVPAEQVAPIFQDLDPQLEDLSRRVQSSVTWTVMVELPDRLKVDFDGAFVADSPLGWICRDSSKPGRARGERWVLQATADWSNAHRDAQAPEVIPMLLDVFSSVTGQRIESSRVLAHRWLYSLPINPVNIHCYVNESLRFGACGDWLNGARVEDAYMSGYSLGHRLANLLETVSA